MKMTLKKFVETSNLVNVKDYGNLKLLKYKPKVFYDNLWCDYLEYCRGLVIDDEYNIIINPFKKIYNHGIEPRAAEFKDSEIVLGAKKINGFMLSVSWYEDDFIFATTGSLESDFINMGREMFFKHVDDRTRAMLMQGGITFSFEVVHPNDPHIIEEVIGLYPLSYRSNEYNAKEHPLNTRIYNFKEIKQKAKKANHEGYIIYSQDCKRATKIKSDYYLIKKFFMRTNKLGRLLDKNTYKRYDEEYYPIIKHVQNNSDEFMAMTEQERGIYIENLIRNLL